MTTPAPVLFNTWKHHAGWVRARVATTPVELLADELVVVGARLMDFYVGSLSPADIADGVLKLLREAGRLDRPTYSAWLDGQGGFAVVELPADGSRWTLRVGTDPERHVHVHPARHSAHTVRVGANALKTAVLAVAFAAPNVPDVAAVNAVRKRYLALPPVPELADGGLAEAVALLSG